MTKLAVKITVIESERGWGRKVDDYMVCTTQKETLDFKQEFNAKNNKDVVPDYYMACEGEPMPIDLTEKQYDKLVSDGRQWLSTLNAL